MLECKKPLFFDNSDMPKVCLGLLEWHDSIREGCSLMIDDSLVFKQRFRRSVGSPFSAGILQALGIVMFRDSDLLQTLGRAKAVLRC